MTAIETEGAAAVSVRDFGELAAASLAGALGHERRAVSRDELDAAISPAVSTLSST
jgi:hypothetical protein